MRTSEILSARGEVISSGACPNCGAAKKKRVPNAGFGRTFAVCGECGFEMRDQAAPTDDEMMQTQKGSA